MCDRAQRRDGCPERAERDRRRIEDEHVRQGIKRRKAECDQECARDRDGRAEACDSFQQSPEAEPHHDKDHSAIVGQMIEHPVTECIEATRYDTDVVEQQGVDDDPHHWPKPEHHAG
jgi:hypothetical protein